MKYIAEIRGKYCEWGCIVETKEQAEAMRKDGIEVMEVHNIIPGWVAGLGLSHVWCFFQDAWDQPSRWWRK